MVNLKYISSSSPYTDKKINNSVRTDVNAITGMIAAERKTS